VIFGVSVAVVMLRRILVDFSITMSGQQIKLSMGFELRKNCVHILGVTSINRTQRRHTMHWPTKVWEPGEIDKDGKQLWYSRIVTKADRQRRLAYEDNYKRREDERLASRR